MKMSVKKSKDDIIDEMQQFSKNLSAFLAQRTEPHRFDNDVSLVNNEKRKNTFITSPAINHRAKMSCQSQTRKIRQSKREKNQESCQTLNEDRSHPMRKKKMKIASKTRFCPISLEALKTVH